MTATLARGGMKAKSHAAIAIIALSLVMVACTSTPATEETKESVYYACRKSDISDLQTYRAFRTTRECSDIYRGLLLHVLADKYGNAAVTNIQNTKDPVLRMDAAMALLGTKLGLSALKVLNRPDPSDDNRLSVNDFDELANIAAGEIPYCSPHCNDGMKDRDKRCVKAVLDGTIDAKCPK
jgi:hypothetical protein